MYCIHLTFTLHLRGSSGLTSGRILLGKIVVFLGKGKCFKAIDARTEWKLGRMLMLEGGLEELIFRRRGG